MSQFVQAYTMTEEAANPLTRALRVNISQKQIFGELRVRLNLVILVNSESSLSLELALVMLYYPQVESSDEIKI